MVADTLQVFNALDPCQIAGVTRKNPDRWWEAEPQQAWELLEGGKDLKPGVINYTCSETSLNYEGLFGGYTFLCDEKGDKQQHFSGELVIEAEAIDQDNLLDTILNDVARQGGQAWKARNKAEFNLTFKHWDDFKASPESTNGSM